MASGIILPIFALGASALGMAAEWGQQGPLIKGLLSLAGGVGSNGLFDWLKARWLTRPPGTKALMENHHLSRLVATALEHGFKLAAAEAQICDPQKRGLALHSARLSKLSTLAKERWLSLVDDLQTPQFDALRSKQLTNVVASVCEGGGNAPVLEIADWEPLIRAMDQLEGTPTLSMAAITHTARVLCERTGRLFYELVKNARENEPEAYAALQLQFFADLKTAAASQNEQLLSIREQLTALSTAMEDGASKTASRSGKSFNWQRLASLLRPMQEMSVEWREFYTRHDQRWDALLAKLDALPDEVSDNLWRRISPHLRNFWIAVPAALALAAGIGWGVYQMSGKLDSSASRETEMNQRLSSLQKRLDELLPVAAAIRNNNDREARANQQNQTRPGAALAEAAAQRKQSPEALRKELADTAKLAADSAGKAEVSQEQKRDYWIKAGDLALAADLAEDAERYYRSALALAQPGSAIWCDVAEKLCDNLRLRSHAAEAAQLFPEIIRSRETLANIPNLIRTLGSQQRLLLDLARYEQAELVAKKITALESQIFSEPSRIKMECLSEILAAYSELGNYREQNRISREINSLVFEDDDRGRFFSALAPLAASSAELFFDEPEHALSTIERALEIPVSSPRLKSTLQTIALRSLINRYPRPPRPPRAQKIVETLSASADTLAKTDFTATGPLLFEKAAMLRSEGRYEEEIALVKNGLLLAKKTYPHGHPEIGLWQCDLARSLTLPAEIPEAENLWREGIASVSKQWGKKHSTTLGLRSDYAEFLQYNQRGNEAVEIQRDVIKKITEVIGPSTPRALHAKLNLLPMLHGIGRQDEILQLRGEVFDMLRAHPRPEQRSMIELYRRYLREPLSQAEFKKFLQTMVSLTAEMDARTSAPNTNTLAFHSQMLSAYIAANQKPDILREAAKCVEIARSVFDSGTIPIAVALRAQSDHFANLGEFAAAEHPLREAVKIVESVSGHDSVTAAQYLVDLARLLADLSLRPEAIATLQRALKILEAKPEDDPLLYYDAMSRLGAQLAADGQYKEAEDLLRRSIVEQEKKTGFDPGTMEMRVVWLSRLLRSNKHFEEAERMLKRVISTGQTFEDGTPAYRISTAFFDYMELLIEIRREREVEIRLRRFLTPKAGKPKGDSFQRRGEAIYLKSLTVFGMGEVDARARRERVLRGENVPEF